MDPPYSLFYSPNGDTQIVSTSPPRQTSAPLLPIKPRGIILMFMISMNSSFQLQWLHHKWWCISYFGKRLLTTIVCFNKVLYWQEPLPSPPPPKSSSTSLYMSLWDLYKNTTGMYSQEQNYWVLAKHTFNVLL